MQTVTVICRERHNAYPDPLIYTVNVNDPRNLDEVEAACYAQRKLDLGDLIVEGSEYDVALYAMFAFAGNLEPIADWRA